MQEFLELLRNGLHGILASTIQTMEEAGCTVCDATDAVPWEHTMDLARQVWDKSRHIEIFLKLLERIEGYSGEALETIMSGRGAGVEPAPAELGCHTLVQLIELAQKIGDPISARALDFVLADTRVQVPEDQAYAVA